MTSAEARNLMPGDVVDFVCGPDYDTGYVKEVRTDKYLTFVLIQSLTAGWGTELVSASRILSRLSSALRKPAPTIKQSRDMTRGYVP